jgi:hypothetical protein
MTADKGVKRLKSGFRAFRVSVDRVSKGANRKFMHFPTSRAISRKGDSPKESLIQQNPKMN